MSVIFVETIDAIAFCYDLLFYVLCKMILFR